MLTLVSLLWWLLLRVVCMCACVCVCVCVRACVHVRRVLSCRVVSCRVVSCRVVLRWPVFMEILKLHQEVNYDQAVAKYFGDFPNVTANTLRLWVAEYDRSSAFLVLVVWL